MTAGGGEGGTGGGRNFTRTLGPVKNYGTPQNPQLAMDPATPSSPGSMSAADKAKLDALAAGVAIGSVATPLTLAAGVLDIQQASATLEGSLSAADFVKVQHLATYASNQDVTLSATRYSFVTAGTLSFLCANAYWDGTNWFRFDTARRATLWQIGEQSASLLFAGPGAGAIVWSTPFQVSFPSTVIAQLHAASAGGVLIAGGALFAYLTANLSFDGANWNRLDTGSPGNALRLSPGGDLQLYSAPAGANPAVLTERFRLSPAGASGIQQVVAPVGELLTAGAHQAYYTVNCTYDGTNWQRLDPSRVAFMLRLGNDTGKVEVVWGPAGANPLTFTQTYTLADPTNRPAVGLTAPGSLGAPYGAGWSAYGGGVAPWVPAYSRDALGYVHLTGLVAKSSALAVPETMFLLPPGFRPAGGVIAACSASPGIFAEVRVLPTGEVQLAAGGSAAYVSLAGVQPFYAAN